jgi:hypothetical protein
MTIASRLMVFVGSYALGLPGEICQTNMALGKLSGRFYAWRKRGLWQQILEQLQQQAHAAGEFG